MYPILLRIGDFGFASWHVFFVLGAMAAWWGLQTQRRALLPSWKVVELDRLFLSLYLAGYFGARVFSLLFEDHVANLQDFVSGLFTFGSMTLYGGIIAVTLVLLAFAWATRTPVKRLAALFVGPGLLGISIGRIGCFLNGDDYGAAVFDQMQPPWWAVVFPNLEDRVYRYPVQLWESALALFLGLGIIMLSRREPQSALRWASFGVLGYSAGRFALEYFRGDERGYFFGTGLSTSQGISIVFLVVWTLYSVIQRLKEQGQEPA